MKDIYRLQINEKFANVAPDLSGKEYSLLKASLLKDGCIDPIVVWNGTIVDGHNRYRICRQNKIPFEVKEMNFKNESEAIQWIIKNQLGRRNLSTYSKCEMVLRFESQLKKIAEMRRREAVSHYRSTGELGGSNMKTRDILAGMADVSHGTLDKAKAICMSGDEKTKDRLRRGEISINFAYKSIFSEPEKGRKSTESEHILSDIRAAIKALTEKVASGEASQKTMLQELENISLLIQDAEGQA